MPETLAAKLIASHLLEGEPVPGEEISLRIDQTLTQDATGTLVMLELAAMELDRVKTELSVQYVDHNLLQEDNKNADDHAFLLSAAQKYGLWFSRAGNGVSHPVHQERFGAPGKTLLGSDSHTCAAGAMGMLAIGAGGLEVAMAMAGFPFHVKMPKIMGVKLTGTLPDWVSAKDVILEMLRRHGVSGGVGKVIEYYGPGLAELSAMDRHVIANMGAELGATATVFPSDDRTKAYLRSQQREHDWKELSSDNGAKYDEHDEVDLSTLEPLIATPTSPGNVRTVREEAGKLISQSYIGSSANPGYRDFAVAAEIVKGRSAHRNVSLDVNPTSRQLMATLTRDSHLLSLVRAGARIHQTGCNGCIGMGQAPATGKISLRTVPRNFPGRSGTAEDCVYLVSPETAAASALTGEITDPRDLEQQGIAYPRISEPADPVLDDAWLLPPLSESESTEAKLETGPNIAELPHFEALPKDLELPVILRMGDDVSTDEILPAGAKILPLRSNIPKISEFAFMPIDPEYPKRARNVVESGHAVVGGKNYGQGSSREHAALAPRYLGLRAVIAESFARIHWQNLVNFGVLPITVSHSDLDKLSQGVVIALTGLVQQLEKGNEITIHIKSSNEVIVGQHDYSPRQIQILTEGGLVNWARSRVAGETAAAHP